MYICLFVCLYFCSACTQKPHFASYTATHVQGFYGRDLPEDFGLQHAGEYLASHFGASYKYIWGLGLLAAGQASTMSGTYTGDAPCYVMHITCLLEWHIASGVTS